MTKEERQSQADAEAWGAAAPREGEDELDPMRIDLLMIGNADRLDKTARAGVGRLQRGIEDVSRQGMTPFFTVSMRSLICTTILAIGFGFAVAVSSAAGDF